MRTKRYIEVHPWPSASAGRSLENIKLALAIREWAKARESHHIYPLSDINGKR